MLIQPLIEISAGTDNLPYIKRSGIKKIILGEKREGVMNPIKSLMGRRQFLIAAGVTSTSALALKNLAGAIDPVFKTSIASAADKPGTAGMKVVTNKYPHLLSPLEVRNKVLKNRIFQTPSPPHSLQGPENYPADAYRSHYSEIAKNAAMVTLVEEYGRWPKTYEAKDAKFGPSHYSDSMWEDIPPVRNYVDQLVEDVHCEGSLVCCGRIGGSRGGANGPGGQGGGGAVKIEDIVTQAKQYEDKGYDAVEVGERDWETGIETVRSAIEYIEAVRKATNLIIVAVILPFTPGLSRGNPHYMVDERSGDKATGPQFEEVLAMVKLLDGLADIVRMKDAGHYTNHPNSFTMEKDKPFMLRFSKAIKESGAKIFTAPNGGFHDPAFNDELIASGKTDLIAMATPLIADPEYLKKISEGRGDDVVPCVMCHDCHGVSRTEGPWFDVCTVNPEWGLSATKKASIRPPSASKKVAVIGGGPAGMKAAITAAERGHKVTLYEKSETMGGLLKHTDYTQWKWTYKDFKDYLVRQTHKAGVEVLLNTTATPEMIKAKGYNTVLVAAGAEPVISKIPGADGKNVFNILTAFSNKNALGKNLVLIGAGTFGTESAICFAKDGYKITVLTSEKEMIPKKAIGPHNKENQIDIYQNHPNISYVLEAITTGISDGKVTYRDSAGNEKSVQADSVIIYAGLKPKMDEAMKFSGSAGQFLMLGDCTGNAGTVQKTIRSAFFTASQV
jgi:2,4-dienoyl-CoA reductase-like NADH-dependent reductase (Old Yellow Enzyme family)/thioredoxin reductase